MAKNIVITGTQQFDVNQALEGASIGFVKMEGPKTTLEQYITNFTLRKNKTGDLIYTGIGSEDGVVYIFNKDGQTQPSNDKELKMIVDTIATSSDTTVGTRFDSTEGTTSTYNISTLLPKDQVAAQVLNGMLSRMTLEEIEALSPARINQLSSQAYKMAQSMINTAAVFREKFGAVESGSTTEDTTPTDNTEKFLDNIGKSIDNLQRKSQATDSGIFLNNTEAKPLYVKTISSGESSGGGGEISGEITANIKGNIGLSNATSQPAFKIIGNSTIGGGQNNLPIVIDAQTQGTLGAIPIAIQGGLVGEWRMKDSTTKYSVSKIALNSPAFNIALNTADNSELVVGLNTATANQEGLMSNVDCETLGLLKTHVGTKPFKLGSTTYTTLQEALDAINTRLVALENK